MNELLTNLQSEQARRRRRTTINKLLVNLQGLNYSNQFDTEATRWSILVDCLDEVTDEEDTDVEAVSRYIKRRGFDSKDAVLSGIESALESKIAELQGLLNQVKGLK